MERDCVRLPVAVQISKVVSNSNYQLVSVQKQRGIGHTGTPKTLHKVVDMLLFQTMFVEAVHLPQLWQQCL